MWTTAFILALCSPLILAAATATTDSGTVQNTIKDRRLDARMDVPEEEEFGIGNQCAFKF